MPAIPVNSPLGYVGVLSVVVGFFLVLAGLDIIKVEKITVTSGARTWAFGIALTALGLAFLLPDILSELPRLTEPGQRTVVSRPAATPIPPTATLPIAPTDTSIPLADTPVPPTDTPLPPTSANTPLALLRLGYSDRMNCPIISHIVQLIMLRELEYQVELVEFDSPEELFDVLALGGAKRVDATLCYWTATDMPYLQEKEYLLGAVDVLGQGYLREDAEGGKWMVLTSGGTNARLKRSAPCVVRFLRQLELTSDQVREFPTYLEGGEPSQAAQTWVDEHPGVIQTWSRCE